MKSDFSLSLKKIYVNIYVYADDRTEQIETIVADIDKNLLPTNIGQKFVFRNRTFRIFDIVWVYDPPVHIKLKVTMVSSSIKAII